jgi:hypothetical protein
LRGFTDADSNGNGNAHSDSNANSNGNSNGYVDAYSDPNRGETVADAEAATNVTAAASLVGKQLIATASGGNSRHQSRVPADLFRQAPVEVAIVEHRKVLL